MFCKNCGQELSGNDRFCPKCGKQIEKQVEQVKKSGGQKKKIICGLLMIVIVAVVGGVATQVLKPRTNSNEVTKDNTQKASKEDKQEKQEEYLATVRDEDGLYGYINAKGEEVIPCMYEYADDFNENGIALVRTEGGYMYINTENKNIMDRVWGDAYTQSFALNGLAAVCPHDVDLYGYIDTSGEVVIDYEYDVAEDFQKNGLAVVGKVDGTNAIGESELKQGCINEEGEVIVPFNYNMIEDFADNGIAVAVEEEWVKKVGEEDTYELVFRHGYVNEEGEEVVPCMYKHAEDFAGNGLAVVRNSEGKYGYIDETGKEVIPFQYEDAESFGENGWAAVQLYEDGDWSYINESGEEVDIDTSNYDRVFSFEKNGLAVVWNREGKRGFIDEKGNEVIPCEFSAVNEFGDCDIVFCGNEIGEFEKFTDKYEGALYDKNGKVIMDLSDKYFAVGDFKKVKKLNTN